MEEDTMALLQVEVAKNENAFGKNLVNRQRPLALCRYPLGIGIILRFWVEIRREVCCWAMLKPEACRVGHFS